MHSVWCTTLQHTANGFQIIEIALTVLRDYGSNLSGAKEQPVRESFETLELTLELALKFKARPIVEPSNISRAGKSEWRRIMLPQRFVTQINKHDPHCEFNIFVCSYFGE